MKFHHVSISVKDLEKSTNFYKDIFGFAEEKRFKRKDLEAKSAFLKLGDIRLELWQFDKQTENKDDFSKLNVLGIKHIAFEVDNIEREYKRLKSKKIEISEPKLGASGGRYCFLKDPDGLPIELYESNSE